MLHSQPALEESLHQTDAEAQGEETVAEGIVICYATCWSCKFGHCNPEPHVWWDGEDQEYNPDSCKPLPEGKCGCNCEAMIAMDKEQEREAVGSVRY